MQSTSNMNSQQQTLSAGSVVPVINVPAQPLLSTTMTAATPVVSLARSAAAGQPSPSALQSNNDNGVPVQGAQLSLPSHVMPSATTVEQAAAAAATSAIQRAQDVVTPPLGTSQNVNYNVNNVLSSGYALAPNSITTTTSSSATSNHIMSNIAAQPQWSSLPSSSQPPPPLPSASAAVPIVTQTPSSSLPSSACAPKSNLSLVLRHGGPFTRGPNSLPPTMPNVPRAPPRRPFPPRFRMPAVVQPVPAAPIDEPVVVLSRSRAVGQSMGMSLGQSTQEQAAQTMTTTTTTTAAAGTSGPIDTAAAVIDKASSSKPTGSLSSKQLAAAAAAATEWKEGKVQKGEKAGEQCVIEGTTTTIKNDALSHQDNGAMKGNDVVATVAPHPKKKKNKQQQVDMQNDVDNGEPLRPTELILDPEEEEHTNTSAVRVVEQNGFNSNSRSQQRRLRRMQEAYALAAVRRANEFDSPAATGLSQNILAPEQLTDSTTHSENTSEEDEVHAMRDTVYRRLPFRARTRYGTSPTTDAVMAPPFARSRSSQSRVERKVSPQAEYTRLPSTEPPHLTGTSSSPHHHRNDAEWNRYRRRYTRRASANDGGSNASIQAWRATHHHNNNYYSTMHPAIRSTTPPTLTAESMTARQLLRWRYDGRRYVRDPTTLHNAFQEPQHTPHNEQNGVNGPVQSFPSTPGIVAPPATSLLREDSPRWHASDGLRGKYYTHDIPRRYTTRSNSIEDDDDDEVAEELYLRRKKYFNDPPLRSPSPRLQQQHQPRYIYANHRPVNNNEATYSPRERGKVDTTALPAHIADTLRQRQEPSRTHHHHHHYNSTTAREGNNNDNGDANTCVIRVTVMNEAQDGGLAQRPSRVTQDMNNRKREGHVSRGTSHYDTQDSASIEMDSHFETGGPCVVVVRLPRKLLRQIKIGHLKRQLERQLGLPAELQNICAEGVALQDAVPLALLQQPSSLTLHWLTGPSVSQAVGGPGSRNTITTTSNTPQASTQGTSLTGQMSRRPSRGFLLLSPPKEGVPSASSTQTTTNTRTTSLVMQQLIRPESHLHETSAGPLANIPGRTSSRSLSQLTSPRLHGLMALLPPLPRRASPITRPRKGHRPRTITSKRTDSHRSATLHREIDAITSDTVSRLSRHGSSMQYTSEDEDEDDKRGRHHSRYSSSSSESQAEEAAPAAVHYSGITAL